MKIGIDVSQLAYEGSGVATFIENLVAHLINFEKKHEFVLFYSSLRREFKSSNLKFQIDAGNVKIKRYNIPPTILDFLWNRLHLFPIEWFIGPVDVFISSDWTQPPSYAKKVTILYDLIVYKRTEETDKKIIEVQKRKLEWVKKEVDKIICISEATKKDAKEILGIPEDRLTVVYPGV